MAKPRIVGLPPRFNFDSFRFSLFTAFQLITTEGWNENFYDVVGRYEEGARPASKSTEDGIWVIQESRGRHVRLVRRCR